MPRQTHYTALDLKKKATQAEIKKAWRKIAFACHPDRAETRGLTKREENKLQRRFQKARAAWEVLGEAETRTTYDKELVAAHRARSRPKPKPKREPTPEELAEQEYRRFLRRQAHAEARLKRRYENMRRARERLREQEREWAVQDAKAADSAEEAYLEEMVVKLRCRIAHFLLGDWDAS